MPVFIGHRPQDPYHISVPCTEAGVPLDTTELSGTNVTPKELYEFLVDHIAILAKLLGKQEDIELVGLRGPDAEGLTYIVSFTYG
jgi:hypothetical protein